MDRNIGCIDRAVDIIKVALRKESVDRNTMTITICTVSKKSLSARRAWIEIRHKWASFCIKVSLSARRAWIEICILWC